MNLLQLFLDLLRIEMAGQRFCKGICGADLDELVSDLDNMTERRVVPGRVFTPSTAHERHDLQLATFAILSAAAKSADNGFEQRIADIAWNEHLVPERDGSLGAVLDAYRSTPEKPLPQLKRGIGLLCGDENARGIRRATDLVIAAQTAITQADPCGPG